MARYFDHNATTPLGDAARAVMSALVTSGAPFGNASSLHARGREARELVERSRRQVGAAFGAAPEGVVFCATGSEAVALGMLGLARRSPRRRVLVGASEHPCVHGAAETLRREGFRVDLLPVDSSARVRPFTIDDDVALVCVQLANHETGVVQPVAEIATLARKQGALVLSDAVQAAGKLPIDLRALGVHAIAVAGHKLYGPHAAALVLNGADIEPLVAGGHQERGRRAGTEALIDVVGFGAAVEESLALVAQESTRERALRAELERGLIARGARIVGLEAERLCNTTLCTFAGAPGQLVAIALDLAGFEASTGAACTSGSVQPSPVLLAAGYSPDEAREAVRFSLGRSTTVDDVEALLAALPEIVARVRRR